MTAQKAKRVAEDEAEYPYTLFLSLRSPRPAFSCSPLLMSLCSIFDYSTSYVGTKAKERYYEAVYKGRDACKSAKYNDEGPREAEAWETRPVSLLTREPRSPQKRGRPPRSLLLRVLRRLLPKGVWR